MRILHLHTTLDPEAGGPPAVVARLATAQAQLGHDVHVVAYHQPGAVGRIRKSLEAVPAWTQVSVHLLGRRSRLERFLPFDAMARVRSLLGRIDVVHTHNTWAPMVVAASRLAREHGIPYVHCPHGALDPWCLGRKALKKRVALRVAQRSMLNRATFLHVLNAGEQAGLAPLRLSVPMEVIPNGVFPEEFASASIPNVVVNRHPELRGVPYIVFLSRLDDKKGLDYLAEAFRIVAAADPHVHLVVVGPDGGARHAFERAIVSAALTHRVRVVGPLYGPERVGVLRGAACFCLVSRQEGFSLAITEALACGLPAVVSDRCHFPEIAEVKAGWVVPLDARAAADALLSVLRDDVGRQEMGVRGAELVKQRFTWPIVAAHTIACYRKYGVDGGVA